MERVTGVREENISSWRRQTFGDLTAAFRFGGSKSASPTLPETGGMLEAARYEATHLPSPVLPGSNQTPPTQEKGTRKRIPPSQRLG